eukprot:CAMPEP_0174756974 /NCGR_PEP_ID=MMETSP1094-20130205/107024_1 /TAXON_ID=156173 /ORGANISM="Chrysochromulina brevifilum, Strain UTEX LB 985" /LENGTH=163 /DNA_ID=CAMNT_0015962889 /DNA_START=1019 /DNA_END=1510 /DNA_ORIENTATION=-
MSNDATDQKVNSAGKAGSRGPDRRRRQQQQQQQQQPTLARRNWRATPRGFTTSTLSRPGPSGDAVKEPSLLQANLAGVSPPGGGTSSWSSWLFGMKAFEGGQVSRKAAFSPEAVVGHDGGRDLSEPVVTGTVLGWDAGIQDRPGWEWGREPVVTDDPATGELL